VEVFFYTENVECFRRKIRTSVERLRGQKSGNAQDEFLRVPVRLKKCAQAKGTPEKVRETV